MTFLRKKQNFLLIRFRIKSADTIITNFEKTNTRTSKTYSNSNFFR